MSCHLKGEQELVMEKAVGWGDGSELRSSMCEDPALGKSFSGAILRGPVESEQVGKWENLPCCGW